MIDYHIIIPARYAASRLPGKCLLDLHGKPILQHVYERSIQAGAKSVTIATDDERILQAAHSFGAKAYLTSIDHTSGTQRIAELVKRLEFADQEIIVNVQGDEPMIPVANISQVAENLDSNTSASIATLYEQVTSYQDLINPNHVKVVADVNGNALYFSRAPIAWDQKQFAKQQIDSENFPHYRHIGIYAYTAKFIQEYVSLEPSPIEKMESLEQLRALWHGKKIHVAKAKQASVKGIDTPEDLELARKSAPAMLFSESELLEGLTPEKAHADLLTENLLDIETE